MAGPIVIAITSGMGEASSNPLQRITPVRTPAGMLSGAPNRIPNWAPNRPCFPRAAATNVSVVPTANANKTDKISSGEGAASYGPRDDQGIRLRSVSLTPR